MNIAPIDDALSLVIGDKLHMTDAGNAQRLVTQHKNRLRYCFTWQKWLTWDDTRWATDETGEVMRAAKATAQAIYGESSSVPNLDDARALGKHAERSLSAARLDAMIQLAQSEPGVAVSPDDLDSDPWLVERPERHAGPPYWRATPARPKRPDNQAGTRQLPPRR